jgi:glycosyltransferase involved in cell wall biosynthesis
MQNTNTILVLSNNGESLRLFRKDLLAKIARTGIKVFATAPRTEFCSMEELRVELDAVGVKLVEQKLSPSGTNPLRELLTFISYIKLIQKIKPDTVLAYTVKPIVYGCLAAAICRVPKIFAMVTGLGYAFTGKSLPRRIIGFVIRSIYRIAFISCHKVFFQNPDDLKLFTEELRLLPPSKAVRINGSGVNTETYAPQPSQNKGMSFLFCGRLLGDKGIREFVAAAKIIKVKYPEVRFPVVGSLYPNPSSLTQEELDELCGTGIIEFLGKTKDIRPYLRDCSVFVLPSYREGTPHSVLEAMAMEKPIITTNVPGCKETVIHGRNGYLVEARDAGALAVAMENFISSPELVQSMGKESRLYCLEKFDVSRVNATILKSMEIAA